MIPSARKKFNQDFTEKKYLEIIEHFMGFRYPLDFRLSESPIFLDKSFEAKVQEACQYIIEYIKDTPNSELEKAIPKELYVPNTSDNPHFLAIDFGICEDGNGGVSPQLIEAQAFPSLYYFQKDFEKQNQEVYGYAPNENQADTETYYSRLKEIILNGHPKEEVILLEINPKVQKTAIDFGITEEQLGIESVCITDIKKIGYQLYYTHSNGITYPIKRIYNRIIWDELLEHKDLQAQFALTDDVEVEWATHPNWFFMVSKNMLPNLKHQYVPESFFVSDIPADIDLSQYVLKPLYSFAGKGVDLHPTEEKLKAIKDPENYILQKKVRYAPVFEDINGEYSKAEIRLLFTWKDGEAEPVYMINMVRMTKADMVNVSFNKKDAIWIGSNIAYFREGEGNALALYDNKEKNRYEYSIDGHLAKIDYQILNNEIFFNFVEVPAELNGKGLGTKLVRAAQQEAEARGLKVTPVCSFAKYVLRHG